MGNRIELIHNAASGLNYISVKIGTQTINIQDAGATYSYDDRRGVFYIDTFFVNDPGFLRESLEEPLTSTDDELKQVLDDMFMQFNAQFINAGGGGGEATSANQVAANAKLEDLKTYVGDPASAVATDSTGTWALIQISKRISQLMEQLGLYLSTWFTPSANLRTLSKGIGTGAYIPDMLGYRPVVLQDEEYPLTLDADGNLRARTQNTTEEGSFKDDFYQSGIETLLNGTLTFTTGSNTVTGVATDFGAEVRRGQYIRADTDTAFYQVSKILHNSELELSEPFYGVTVSEPAYIGNYVYATGGTGAAITYQAATEAVLTSGTEAGGGSSIFRDGDMPPMIIETVLKISQRIDDQLTEIGFIQEDGIKDNAATFVFTGINDTQVTLYSTCNAIASFESTTVSLPNAGVTSDYHAYNIRVSNDFTSFYIDNVLVGKHTLHIPSLDIKLGPSVSIVNTNTVTSTDVTVDLLRVGNMNRLEVKQDFGLVEGAATEATQTAMLSRMPALINNRVPVGLKRSLTDAAGRVKISAPTPQISIKYRYDKLPLLVSEVLSGGTATFDSPNSCVTMAVSAGQYVIRQTFKRGNYVSGIAMACEFTMSAFHVQANVTKAIGYYSSSTSAPYTADIDGIRLYNDGTTVRLQVYRTGTLVHDEEQADWLDPLDGTGASGVTIDWSLLQVCMVDFIWLSGGPVRFWMNLNGEFQLMHEFISSNSETFAWMTSPNQPIRYELRSTTGSGTLNQICSSIYSDDSGQIASEGTTGQPFSIKSGSAAITAVTAGTTYAMLGVRLSANRLDAGVLIRALSAMNTSNNFASIRLLRNPAVAGTFTYNSLTDSPIEYAVGALANTVTGGFEVGAWPFDRQLGTTLTNRITSLLGSSVDGVSETYVLCVVGTTNNVAWVAQMNLIELI